MEGMSKTATWWAVVRPKTIRLNMRLEQRAGRCCWGVGVILTLISSLGGAAGEENAFVVASVQALLLL